MTRIPLQLALLAVLLTSTLPAQVLPGADLLLGDSLHLVADRRVGVLCHRASLLADGTHLLDTLAAAGIDVRVIFTPEHGFDASAPAGVHVASGLRAGTPVHSLYGTRRAPDSAALAALDVLVCDLQDVGARYYTYISTLALVMRAAAAAHLPVVVLDRPNPINGIDIEGPLLDTARASFVGMFPIPIRHGMTIGELARMIAGEAWLGAGVGVDLRVLPLRGWRRAMYYDETGLVWSRPSPNIPTLETAILYPGTCLVEGTNLSEGRGTEAPFQLVGAPFVDTARCAALLQAGVVRGLHVSPAGFTPGSRPEAPDPKWKDAACTGMRIEVADRRVARPVRAVWTLLATLRACAPGLRLVPMFERLAGMTDAVQRLDAAHLDEEFARWARDEALFARARMPYLLY